MSGEKAKSMTIKVTVTVEYGNGDRGEASKRIMATATPECGELPPAQDYATAMIACHIADLHRFESEE